MNRIMELFNKSPVVDFKSIERIINKKGYAKVLISNLIKNKKIRRISKGKYTQHYDSSLFVLCISNSYLGLQSALSFHNLWEQETIPIILTSNRIRIGIRNVMGGNVLVRRINKKFVFGIDYYKDGDFYLPYSDIEKTFIDMIVFKQYMSKNVLDEFKKRIDIKKLEKYLKKYSKRTYKRVMNFIDCF